METAMNMYQNKYNFKDLPASWSSGDALISEVVTWEPYLLRPDMPPDGVDKPSDYGPDTPGSRRLIHIGKDVGIDFSYKSKKFPNTIVAHCALEYALEQDPTGKVQNDLQEVLFKSYFTDGEYPDVERVTSLAEGVGLNRDGVKAYISDATHQNQILTKARQWSGEGVSGVPFFIINGQKVFSGAQDPNNFLHVFDKVAEKFSLPSKA